MSSSNDDANVTNIDVDSSFLSGTTDAETDQTSNNESIQFAVKTKERAKKKRKAPVLLPTLKRIKEAISDLQKDLEEDVDVVETCENLSLITHSLEDLSQKQMAMSFEKNVQRRLARIKNNT